MDEFQANLNDVISFEDTSGKTRKAAVLGIDHYTFNAADGGTPSWDSYTLVDADKAGSVIDDEDKYYLVNVPLLGPSFVEVVEPSDVPDDANYYKPLSGPAHIESEGYAEGGTGNTIVMAWQVAGENVLYAREIFLDSEREENGNHPEATFRITPLKQAPVVLQP